MRTFTKEQLAETVKKHGQWLRSEAGGERADLSNAYLSYVDFDKAYLGGSNFSYSDLRGSNLSNSDLSYADLSHAILKHADLKYVNLYGACMRGACLSNVSLQWALGNMSHVKSILLDTYHITYTRDALFIGCKGFPISAWWSFSEDQIREMNGEDAVVWWRKYKSLIQQAVTLSPAEATTQEDEQ